MGIAHASNTMSAETQAHVNADIARIHAVNEYTKTRVGASFLGVGTDQDCHYSTIQEALNAFVQSGAAEIRVARNKTYDENLIIDDMDVTIVGGYLDCFNMGLPNAIGGPGTSQAIIDGNDAGSVIRIQNTSEHRTIVLKNLRLLNGETKGPGGGLVAYVVDARVSLINVDIRNNTAHYGAGIAIIGDGTDMTLQNSRVISNTANYGGGVYCTASGVASGSTMVLTDSSGIIANLTNGTGAFPNGNGGGAFIDEGCYFAMYSGSNQMGVLAGVSFNTAEFLGGGIYARNATILLNGHENCNVGDCIGDDINPVNLTGNVAYSGGGLSGSSSTVTIYAALIDANSSESAGGGISANGTLEIGRLHKGCWNQQHCNYFQTNSSQKGGAIKSSVANIDISSTGFENNTAFDGAAIYMAEIVSHSLRVEGSVFNHNGNNFTESIIYTRGAVEVEFMHNTLADNTASSAIFESAKSTLDSSVIPDLQVHSSIIDNQFIPVLKHNISSYPVHFSHIISNEITSMSNANTINDEENIGDGSFISFAPTFLESPLFVDRNNRNYHLAANSPAIDYAHARLDVRYKDMDFEDRAFDDSDIEDNYFLSWHDIGADEHYAPLEVIFKDGFE